jgi:hypothetical protein
MLRGALVQVNPHLMHWQVAHKQDGASATDSYTTDVVSIRVLSEPTTTRVTTTKQCKLIVLTSKQ